MARRATPRPTPESRFIASRIQDARRRGATNREIGIAFGMNERTVRKIISGETPGTRIYHRKVDTRRPPATANDFRADIEIAPGEIRTVNVRIPDLPTIRGRAAPTPFDVFRIPRIEEVIEAEADRMRRRYKIAEMLDDCQRSYCKHEAEVHDISIDEDTGELVDTGPCAICRCPEYQEFKPQLSGLRKIVDRNPAKRLVVIRGYST